MQLDNVPRDSESESEAAVQPCRSALGLPETFKYVSLKGGWKPYSGILNDNVHM